MNQGTSMAAGHARQSTIYLLIFSSLALGQSSFGKKCPEELAHPTPNDAKFSVEAPLDFIKNLDTTASMGQAVSAADPKLKSRLYFAMSEPNADGDIPLVAHDAKAVVIYFHGSGTKKAGGRNFLSKMEALINSHIAPIGVDLPFHGEGPNDSQFYDLNYFMLWLDGLVNRLAAYGKPIYMVGHSFGPFVIKEYRARYPKKIAGALYISDAEHFHEALVYTYNKITSPGMRFIDENLQEYEGNELGGIFAGEVERKATWMRRPAPEGRSIWLRGTNDEWFSENTWLPKKLGVAQPYGPRVVEDWLKAKFPNAEFRFVPGVGHYIFESTDTNGKNLIQNMIFDLVGIPEKDRFAPKRSRSAREEVALWYYTNPIFRAWLGAKYKHALATEARAAITMKGWFVERDRLWWQIFARIPESDPQFYAAREVTWQILKLRHENDVKKAKEKASQQEALGWDADVKAMQTDYGRYLEAKLHNKPFVAGPDRLKPAAPTFNPELFQHGKMYRSGLAGPIDRSVVEESLGINQATIQGVELSDDRLIARITYTTAQQPAPLSIVAFNATEEADVKAILSEAYADAFRQNEWKPLPKSWSGSARGINIRGTQIDNVIQTVEILWPTP